MRETIELNDVRAELERMAEPEYAAFAAKLLPGVDDLLGVRLPRLRALARRLAKGDAAAYLDAAGDDTFEERMLQGMVIGYWDAPAETVLARAAAFVPKIDNWSVCDSFCSGLKLTRAAPRRVWEFLTPYWDDPRPFAVRFAVVMLLFYYIDAAHLPAVFDRLAHVRSEDYYVKMAVAWAASMCCAAFPEKTWEWLRGMPLDEWTHEKTVRKICESRQISAAEKQRFRRLAWDGAHYARRSGEGSAVLL